MQRSNIIAASASLAAMLIGTLFALLYTTMKVNFFTYGGGGVLPGICLLFHRLTLPALLVPAFFAAALGVMIKRKQLDQSATVIVVAASSLFTLFWVLACLLIWELPYITVSKYL
jgi:hypothetical protein